jgi:diketogulonate reductase-like aldo/keto reductase
MESIQRSGKARLLGVSNVTLEQLEELFREASVKPSFVQNRCYASQVWDRSVREFCSANGIVYQGFSLLTANQDALSHAAVGRIARRHGRTPSQIIFRFALDVGMLPLTGTTSASHMQADLSVLDFHLDEAEVAQIEGVTGATS